MIKIPKYPDDFFSFKIGVDISDDQINEWIEKNIQYLEENKKVNLAGTASGNTFVRVTRFYPYEDNFDTYEYQVVVAKGYSSANVSSK
jgi:hypothetical protein